MDDFYRIRRLPPYVFEQVNRAKAAAQSARCKSNLRQLDLGLTLYVADFHKYPICFSGGAIWVDLLEPYTAKKISELYQCPGFKGSRLSRHTSYGYNRAGMINLSIAGQPLPLGSSLTNATPESAVKCPSDLYAFADARVFTNIISTTEYDPYGVLGFDPYGVPEVVLVEFKGEPHSAGRNIVFCDGHIEVVRRSKLLMKAEQWSQRWYTDHEPHSEQWSSFATP